MEEQEDEEMEEEEEVEAEKEDCGGKEWGGEMKSRRERSGEEEVYV